MLIISTILVIFSILLTFMVTFRKYHRISNISLGIGLISTSAVILGDAICIKNPELINEWKSVVFVCESIMVVSWMLFSVSFARVEFWRTINKFSKTLLFILPPVLMFFISIPIEDMFYSSEFKSERILFLGNEGFIFHLLLLLYSVMSIIHLETTLRSSSGMNRWNIKYSLIGIGGILSINIFYYSYALLYRSIDMNLLPVRAAVVFISMVILGFSLVKNKAMDIEVAVSRKVLYKSLSIFIVGLYLLGLGIIGEGMRYFGPQVGKNITMFLGFIGAIAVIAIILSETLRRKAIVFINKNFYSQKYDYRDQWLKFTQQISLKGSFDELLKSIAEGFKNAIGSKGSSVWLKEKGSGDIICTMTVDSEISESRPNKELLAFMEEKTWIINIYDENCKAITSVSDEFLKETDASLVVPLLNVDKLIGFVILREGLAEYEYNYEDYDLLKTLARQATAAILNARLSEELSEAKEMEVMGRLSSFIIHDLKNAASMLSLIVQNAKEHINNPEFQQDAIRAVAKSSEKIKNIIEKLSTLPKKTMLNIKYTDLGECVKAVISEIKLSGNSKIHFQEIEPVKAGIDREEIGKVIINLIINALDASSNAGDIEVTVGKEKNMGFIRVSDKGCGMSSEFIERNLFKPFYTTKKKGLGIGLYQSKVIIDAHSGKMKINSQVGKGTDFFICLPLDNPQLVE